MALIETAQVTTTYLNIKFEPSVKVSTLVNPAFTVTNITADPDTVVASPFKPIDITKDYNSLAKVLTLYWNDGVLAPSTAYTIAIDGLKNAAGTDLDPGTVEFTTPTTLPTEPEENDVNVPPDPPVIVDFTLESGDYDFVEEQEATSDRLKVMKTSIEDGEIFVESTHNKGRFIVRFNRRPALPFVNGEFFRVQRKEIKRSPSRWESVKAFISIDPIQPWVYVDFPTADERYGLLDQEYFVENFKYRLIISKHVGSKFNIVSI
jgi:hypothetical protein